MGFGWSRNLSIKGNEVIGGIMWTWSTQTSFRKSSSLISINGSCIMAPHTHAPYLYTDSQKKKQTARMRWGTRKNKNWQREREQRSDIIHFMIISITWLPPANRGEKSNLSKAKRIRGGPWSTLWFFTSSKSTPCLCLCACFCKSLQSTQLKEHSC